MMGVEQEPWGQKEERKGKRGREEGDSQSPLPLLALKFLAFAIFNVMIIFHVSEYDPAYQTPHFSNTSLMHLQSSSAYSDTLCIGLRMLCNSALPPASAPPHMLPPLVCLFVYLFHWPMCCLFCLFVSPSGLVLLIDGQWTRAKSDCTCSIRRGLGRRLRSSLLLNSSPSTSRDHPLVT